MTSSCFLCLLSEQPCKALKNIIDIIIKGIIILNILTFYPFNHYETTAPIIANLEFTEIILHYPPVEFEEKILQRETVV